jgi:phosphoribosyl-ATP pyrophosphohydrolase
VARLFAKGPDAILKKIGEEATETVMACKDGVREDRLRGRRPVVPLMVAWRTSGSSPADVLAELRRREGRRASRNSPPARHNPATRREKR